MKTKKVLVGVSATAMTLALAGCGSSEGTYEQSMIPSPPQDNRCNDWEWDEDDQLWECDDHRSSYYGHYHYMGNFYSNTNKLKSSKNGASYSNYLSSSSSNSSKSSSGFGSGSTSSGG